MPKILFDIDEPMKRKAQHKALDIGLSLAAVLRGLIVAWLRGDLKVELEAIGNGENTEQPGSAS